jgi:hypothetical protein
VSYTYHPQVLGALARHGIHPTSTTPPERVHEFVSDLYRFELRRLRKRQVRGEIAKDDYAGHVVQLRRRYILISVPLGRWTVSDDRAGATAGAPSTPTRQSD